MKKKLYAGLLFTAALLAGVHSAAVAQNSATSTASANVVAGIDISTNTNIHFRDIVAGTSKFLDARDQTVTASNGGLTGVSELESFGSVKIGYSGTGTLNFEITFPEELEGESSDATLSADFSANGEGATGANAVILDFLSYSGNPRNDPLATPLNGGEKNDWTSESSNVYTINNYNIPSSGEILIVVGGKVTANEQQSVEAYQGSITVKASVFN